MKLVVLPRTDLVPEKKTPGRVLIGGASSEGKRIDHRQREKQLNIADLLNVLVASSVCRKLHGL